MHKGKFYNDEPFATEKVSYSSYTQWPRNLFRQGKLPYVRLRPFPLLIVLLICGITLVLRRSSSNSPAHDTLAQLGLESYRQSDTVDTFDSYKYRETCAVSSLDLYTPLRPLCTDLQGMLKAMSSGGRIGMDAPYSPRGCDMRWFSTEEVCEILGRFEKIILIGDSMLRHVMGSINILIREDLGYGAVTDWNFSDQERRQCFCNEQFDVKSCSVQGIYKTSDVIKNDPGSLACPSNSINLMIEQINKYPPPEVELDRLKDSIGTSQSKRPLAFILGHGLWSDLDLDKTVHWLDLMLLTISNQLPHLAESPGNWHRLFITPNAAGKRKPGKWLISQGNKALMLFEEAMGIESAKREIDHLGTWNMSIQANKFDGVHLDMRGNLVKAMMVMNWLDMLPV